MNIMQTFEARMTAIRQDFLAVQSNIPNQFRERFAAYELNKRIARQEGTVSTEAPRWSEITPPSQKGEPKSKSIWSALQNRFNSI